jgi:hypothetical protein
LSAFVEDALGLRPHSLLPLLQIKERIMSTTPLLDLFPVHKASMHIMHNDHLNNYETAASTIREELRDTEGYADDWPSPEEMQKAIATNEIWEVRWFPNTPVGSCVVYAATLEAALAFANE